MWHADCLLRKFDEGVVVCINVYLIYSMIGLVNCDFVYKSFSVTISDSVHSQLCSNCFSNCSNCFSSKLFYSKLLSRFRLVNWLWKWNTFCHKFINDKLIAFKTGKFCIILANGKPPLCMPANLILMFVSIVTSKAEVWHFHHCNHYYKFWGSKSLSVWIVSDCHLVTNNYNAADASFRFLFIDWTKTWLNFEPV